MIDREIAGHCVSDRLLLVSTRRSGAMKKEKKPNGGFAQVVASLGRKKNRSGVAADD